MPKAAGTAHIVVVECTVGEQELGNRVLEAVAIAIERVLRMRERERRQFLRRSGF